MALDAEHPSREALGKGRDDRVDPPTKRVLNTGVIHFERYRGEHDDSP
jgi:hypothetical protein